MTIHPKLAAPIAALILIWTGTSVLSAQDNDQNDGQNSPAAAAATPAPPDCSAPQHRQFDFWLGEWRVEANDSLAGHNTIRSAERGCVLVENWRGAPPNGETPGSQGMSMNFYDRRHDRWEQLWVDGSGGVLRLKGGLDEDGNMVLSGQRQASDGSGPVYDRISWTPNDDGSVRQLWENSRDDSNWQIVFDGIYRPIAPAAAGDE